MLYMVRKYDEIHYVGEDKEIANKIGELVDSKPFSFNSWLDEEYWEANVSTLHYKYCVGIEGSSKQIDYLSDQVLCRKGIQDMYWKYQKQIADGGSSLTRASDDYVICYLELMAKGETYLEALEDIHRQYSEFVEVFNGCETIEDLIMGVEF